MYCHSCGTRVPDGRSACVMCGAPVLAPAMAGVARPRTYAPPVEAFVPACPRCGFRGPGDSYFASMGHIALLGVLFFGTFFGGFLYLLLRHNHKLCPHCGLSWGAKGRMAKRLPAPPLPAGAPVPGYDDDDEREGGSGWAIFLFVMAAVMAVSGITAGVLGPVMAAGLTAGGGLLVQQRAKEKRSARRARMIQGLQMPVLLLAADRGGELTVTQVATELGWPLPRAEKVLRSLEDGYRVVGDVADDGVVVFRFPELLHARLAATPPPLPAEAQRLSA